jgi:glycosyltransferase involved in cell wall biosynthesis
MNIALFYYGNPPEQGGVGHVLDSLLRLFNKRDHNMYFFNPYYKTDNTINIHHRRKYSILNYFSKIKNKKFVRYSLFAVWSILKDKRTKLSDRLKILIYLLVKPNILLNTIDNILEIHPKIEELKVDVILAGTGTGDTLSLVFLLSRMLNKKVASLAYGNEFLVHSRFSLRTFLFKNIDLLILGTNALKDLIKKIHHLDDDKLAVINYGLIPEDYDLGASKKELRKEFNISEDDYVLISVGRHVSRKRFDLVIDAIGIIKEQVPSIKIKYFLIGKGAETQRLIDLTKSMNLEKYVEFLGFTDIQTRNKFLKLSDIFVMPSIIEKESIEGFGIVFIEANYFHTPVIGTFSGGIIEAVDNGETGLLVNENDLNDLVDKILFFHFNRDKIISMGIKGHERVIKKFNWNLIIDDYINLFARLISGKGWN